VLLSFGVVLTRREFEEKLTVMFSVEVTGDERNRIELFEKRG
jgi:hypothetical protein